jgi:cold shock CspA family protein
MGNKLYVGNLPYSYRDSDMEQAFSQYGTVTSAKVMMERDTGRSKGFGFVEMGSDAEALSAIEAMNGHSFQGRALTVNEARPMEARPPRTGGGGYGGGGGGYGGGGGGGYGGGGGRFGGGGGGGGFGGAPRRSAYPSAPRETGPVEDMTGVVKWYNPAKGFGFIAPDDGGRDVFVHRSALERARLADLQEGQRVQIGVTQGQKGREVATIDVVD